MKKCLSILFFLLIGSLVSCSQEGSNIEDPNAPKGVLQEVL